MSIATITSKGQVTLPKEIRQRLHLETGEKIDFRMNEENGTATLVPLNKRVDDVFGLLSRKTPKKPITTDEMKSAVQEKFRRRFS
jgi:antitoxin PrlF